MEKNNKFWELEPAATAIEWIPVSDSILTFQNGEIDITVIPVDLLKNFENNKEFKIVKNFSLHMKDKTFEKVGLETNYNFLKKQTNELSGRQRKKVTIARAMSMEPKLLLADEISSMLDESGKLNIMRLLKQLQYNIGFSVLLVTHDITLPKKVADYIYYMDSWCIIEEGSVRKIFCKKKRKRWILMKDLNLNI